MEEIKNNAEKILTKEEIIEGLVDLQYEVDDLIETMEEATENLNMAEA